MSEVATHSPGPWGTIKGQYSETMGGQWLVRDAESIYVAHVHPRSDDGRPDATADANARLIAAAPDLLAACQFVLDNAGGPPADMLSMIRAAVRKATEG